MGQIVVKLIGKGTTDDPIRVNLPNYTMVGEPDYARMTATIEVPDDELVIEKDRPDVQKLRKKYQGQPAWDWPGVASDV